LIRIFVDFEATDKNPYAAEILTGFFEKESGESYEFNCRVDKWSDEAAKIHGITEFEANFFDTKEDAFGKLLNWLPDEFELICYANPRTQLGYMLYDVALLQLNLMDYLNINKIEHLPVKIKGFSVHSVVKEAHKNGLFDIITNGEAYELCLLTDKKYIGTNRVSYRQTIVYYSLFGEYYDSHKAKDDVVAMIRIYKAVNELLDTGISIKQKNQLELF